MQYYNYRLEAKVTQHSSCSEAEKGAGGSSQSSENDGPSQMTALLESLKYQQEVVELERKVSASQASLSAQLLTHPLTNVMTRHIINTYGLSRLFVA